MYPKEFFIEQFQNVDTEELLLRYAHVDLTDQAREAILHVLKQRGVAEERVAPLVREMKKAYYRQTQGTKNCDFCNSLARFSPILDGGQRFCTHKCRDSARMMELSIDIPEEEILRHAVATRNGPCPRCQGTASKVEVRRYHTVWSIIVITGWAEKQGVCCAACGRKENFTAITSCMVLGWWGYLGILMTPIQIIANIREMFRKFDDGPPSEDLVRASRLRLAQALYAQGRARSGF